MSTAPLTVWLHTMRAHDLVSLTNSTDLADGRHRSRMSLPWGTVREQPRTVCGACAWHWPRTYSPGQSRWRNRMGAR